jgi:hypothetical protein
MQPSRRSASLRTSAGRPGVAVCWLVVVSRIVSSPFVTPSRARTRAKTKHPSIGAAAAGREECDLPTLPPTHPAECLPVGCNYTVVATPACADAMGSKPSLPAPTLEPAPRAACPRVRIGRRCGMRFMGLGSDVVVGGTVAESLPRMGEKAQVFFVAQVKRRGQKRNTKTAAAGRACAFRLRCLGGVSFAADSRFAAWPRSMLAPHPPFSAAVFLPGKGASGLATEGVWCCHLPLWRPGALPRMTLEAGVAHRPGRTGGLATGRPTCNGRGSGP